MSGEKSVSEFLASLETERESHATAIAEHQRSIAELDRIIPAIRARVDAATEPTRPEIVLPMGIYGGLSIRMALLKHLAMARRGKTADLVKALLDGGFEVGEADFPSNVSATLSAMRAKRQEVDREGEEWVITQVGREEAIKNGFQSWV